MLGLYNDLFIGQNSAKDFEGHLKCMAKGLFTKWAKILWKRVVDRAGLRHGTWTVPPRFGFMKFLNEAQYVFWDGGAELELVQVLQKSDMSSIHSNFQIHCWASYGNELLQCRCDRLD